MTEPPWTRRASWSSAVPDPGPGLLRATAAAGGRVGECDSTGFTADFGSALRFRLLGLLGGRRNVPLRVELRIEQLADGAAHVVATTTDTKGWYAVELPIGTRMFDERWKEILRGLLAAAPPRIGVDLGTG